MYLAFVITYIGIAFFYAYLSMKLNPQLAPLKIAYLLASFFFIILLCGNWNILLPHSYIQFQVPANVTYNGKTYEVNITVVQIPCSDQYKKMINTVLYGNVVMLGITVFMIIVMLIKGTVEPVQEILELIERRGR